MSGGALESSITLEDVFTVVQGKRVPLAAELAGYLALEIADGAIGDGAHAAKGAGVGGPDLAPEGAVAAGPIGILHHDDLGPRN